MDRFAYEQVYLVICSILVFLDLSGPSPSAQDREVAYRVGPLEVLGDGPSYVEVGLGAFDAHGGDGEISAVAEIQLRWGRKLWFIGPAIRLLGNTDGGVFGYAGIDADVAYGNVVITPLLGAGGYAEGGSKHLGGVFQFRVGLGIAYEFANRTRLGLRLSHLSNAGIHDKNPSEEELYITYTWPLP